MKRLFRIEWPDEFGKEWLGVDELNDALRAGGLDASCKAIEAMRPISDRTVNKIVSVACPVIATLFWVALFLWVIL